MLVLIGGAEDKKRDRTLLRAVAGEAAGGALVVCTAATRLPQIVGPEYARLFRDLGVDDVRLLDVRRRAEAETRWALRTLEGARVLFFTGGDQRRIGRIVVGTPLHASIVELHQRGGTVAGTSAGAVAMAAEMLVGGPATHGQEATPLQRAPGLGLLPGTVVDSHFFQRGRFGRLLGAVGRAPADLGIGIDEDTALVVGHDGVGRVLGRGGVYIVDAADTTAAVLADGAALGVRSVHGARVHLLAAGEGLDLWSRRPSPRGAQDADAADAGDGAIAAG
jgi:cyanophycinase